MITKKLVFPNSFFYLRMKQNNKLKGNKNQVGILVCQKTKRRKLAKNVKKES